MVTRRRFIVATSAAAAASLVPIGALAARSGSPAAQPASTPVPGGTLDPLTIPKYAHALIIPPAMPQSIAPLTLASPGLDYYEIAVRQFSQQVLPPPLPQTTVWSYGSLADPAGTFNYPAFTIVASYQRTTLVKWVNQLVDGQGNYLPHLLAVDPTLHWANPPGGLAGRDTRPTFASTPGPYTGPVPIITHVHGAHVAQESDGYAEAWFLPNAGNIPAGYATTGTQYDIFKASSPLGTFWGPGSAIFRYPNDQRATTLWYHDHTLGMTRLNVYAGPAGFYIIQGGPDDLPAGVLPGPMPLVGDAPGTKYYEIPIVVQDRSFNSDGSLFFPGSRADFDGYAGPYIPDSDVAPIWNPEFFGNTMVVNGRAWPKLDVEQRRYRFRLLNGCNSRFLILKLDYPDGLPFWQIGSDGGFLPQPVQLQQLLMGPAERADVVVDFTGVPVGTEITLLNLGPDEPFNGQPFSPADPETTGVVMRLVVVAATGADTSTPPAQLTLPAFVPLGQPARTRRLSLNEEMSEVADIPAEALLGLVGEGSDDEPVGMPLHWMDRITETPTLHSTEVWELYNFTGDAHPIHIHLVQFQVVDRQPFNGAPRAPEPGESGYKDTVVAYPDEITRVKARFDLAGLYVWHCHIVDHEDNEMMRPYRVVENKLYLPLTVRG